MNTIFAMDTLSSVFEERYEVYRGKGCWSDFGGDVSTLFPSLSNINFAVGTVNVGQVGIAEKIQYIFITSKVGKFMLYQKKDGSIHYYTEESFSICQTAKQNGFGETKGEIDTLEKLEYIFAIADSYQ